MKISFTLHDDPRRPSGYLTAMALPESLFYEAYIADVAFELEGRKEEFQSVPLLYFVSTLQDLLLETFLTGRSAKGDLWDTGLKLSLMITDESVVELDIPTGTSSLRYPLREFVMAFKTFALDLLWIMFDDEPLLLSKGELFAEGSPLSRAAQLILQDKVARGK